MAALGALEVALLHSIWQMAGIAAGLGLALRSRRLADPNARYVAAALCLLGGAAAFLATFAWALLGGHATALASVGGAAMPGLGAPVVGVWALGVGGIGGRHLVGYWILRRWRAEARRIGGRWAAELAALGERLGVAQIELACSARVSTPAVVGWLRPTILVPLGFLSGLQPREIEAVLAHELAHIRRHDVLVNLVQVMIEAALFYHPAVWWMSRQVRIEREHCCDELAAAAIGDRKTLARALLGLELWRGQVPALSVAALGSTNTSGEGELMSRVKRVINPTMSRPTTRAWVVPALASLCLGGFVLAAACDAEPEPVARAGEGAVWQREGADSALPVPGDHVAIFIDEEGKTQVLGEGDVDVEALIDAAKAAGDGSGEVFFTKGGEGADHPPHVIVLGEGALHVDHGEGDGGGEGDRMIFVHRDGEVAGQGGGDHKTAVFVVKDGEAVAVEPR